MAHAPTGLVCRFTALIVPPREELAEDSESEAPEERWLTEDERRAPA